MQRLFQWIKSLARSGCVALSWVLVALVIIQVFYAGHAILVSPGDWTAHENLGHAFGRLIFSMFVLGVIGRFPIRLQLLSLALYVLYAMQYAFIHFPGGGLLFMRAFHAVNALVLLVIATHVARSSWRLLSSRSFGRILVLITLAVVILSQSVTVSNQSGAVGKTENELRATSLRKATESSVPERFTMLTNPVTSDDDTAVTAGRHLAIKFCAACHGRDFTGTPSGIGASDLTHSAMTRSDQFLLWAISEGSAAGMPGWKSRLNEQERWQLVSFIKSLGD